MTFMEDRVKRKFEWDDDPPKVRTKPEVKKAEPERQRIEQARINDQAGTMVREFQKWTGSTDNRVRIKRVSFDEGEALGEFYKDVMTDGRPETASEHRARELLARNGAGYFHKSWPPNEVALMRWIFNTIPNASVRDEITRGASTGGTNKNRAYIASDILNCILQAGYDLKVTRNSNGIERHYKLMSRNSCVSQLYIYWDVKNIETVVKP